MSDEEIPWIWVDHRYNDHEVLDDFARLRPLAQEFLYGFEGDNAFLTSVAEQAHRITARQVRGVLNCMRTYGRGRRILERGPKPIEVREPEPTWMHEVCPQVRHRVEHSTHYFPLRSEPGSSKHCLGWHKMTRKAYVVTRARFHKPFVRASKSNLLHRSTHVGFVEWYPENLHQPGPSIPYVWWVGRACTRYASPLKRPDMLTVEEARAALPHVGPAIKYDALTLCPDCFPGTNYEVVGQYL